jgi:hypothetical protein
LLFVDDLGGAEQFQGKHNNNRCLQSL